MIHPTHVALAALFAAQVVTFALLGASWRSGSPQSGCAVQKTNSTSGRILSGAPGGASMSAHWGDSVSTLDLLTGTTTLPVGTIDQNPSGAWSIVNGGTGLQYSGGTSGLFLISIAATVANTGVAHGTMSYCAFQIFDKTMQLSSVPFLGSEEGPQVVMSSILATLAPGDILSASVLVQIDRQFVVGNALGAAPRNGIQYTIVQIG